jgi:predicted enzyme related to lactoylglutathione lyase
VAGHRADKGILPVYVVPDLEATTQHLRGLGWKPHEGPVEIPDGPCYLFLDPSGNEIALVGDERPHALGS